MRILRCVLVLVTLSLGPIGFAPVDALARQSMSFSPGHHARSRAPHVVRHGRAGRTRGRVPHAARGRTHAVRSHAPTRTARPSRGGEGDAATAVPGKGFTLENGILTYPAPARFQPKNLRPR